MIIPFKKNPFQMWLYHLSSIQNTRDVIIPNKHENNW